MREAWKILILVGVVLASATAVRSSEDARLLALDVLSPQGAAIQQLEAKVEALSAAERGSFVRWVRVEGARLAIQPGGPKPGLYVDDDAFLMERARRAAALAVAGGALAKPKDKRQEATFEQIVAANFQLWSKKEDRASLRLNPDQTFVLDLGWGFTPRILKGRWGWRAPFCTLELAKDVKIRDRLWTNGYKRLAATGDGLYYSGHGLGSAEFLFTRKADADAK